MSTTDEKVVPASFVHWPQKEWIDAEGVPFIEGIYVDLRSAETRAWPRFGMRGAVIKVFGGGDFLDCWLFDIPAASATNVIQHLFDPVFYVVSGHGTTEIEAPSNTKHSFEWGPKSVFSISLNARYRLFNTSGTERAVLGAVTYFPLGMNLFHSEKLIFENPLTFPERFNTEEHFRAGGTTHLPGQHNRLIWETMFVPDITVFEQPETPELAAVREGRLKLGKRGYGAWHPGELLFGEASIRAGCAQIPPGRYKKAHRHDAGFYIFTTGGPGYSLMWPRDGVEPTRVDWEHGIVYAPPNQWWHQHFNTGPRPVRYVPVYIGSNRYPLTADRRAQYMHDKLASGPGLNDLDRRLGGAQIEYDDENPMIRDLFRKEVTANGGTVDMPDELYVPKGETSGAKQC